MLRQALLVAAGGFFGTLARFLTVQGLERLSRSASFPLGTLVVNIVGCFAFGWLAALAETRGWMSPTVRLALGAGFLGGFTTFSAFAYEALGLGSEGRFGAVLLHLAFHLFLGIAAAWAGYALGRVL